MRFLITAVDIGLLTAMFGNKSLFCIIKLSIEYTRRTSTVGLGFQKNLSSHSQIVFATREVVDDRSRVSLQTREYEAW